MMNEHQFNKGANNQPSEHLMLCMECGRYPRDIVMMPCLHCTHCSRCGDHLPACKVCSRNIYSKLHILFENSVK
uniref:RING-type domain-containing protein n=1 Tax=Ditylenchus dipsaci TaxID=166011 RepID=A0A915EJT1_9BILA